MKKLVPKILIALILVNLFMPFSVALNTKGTPTLQKSTAEAAGTFFIQISPKITSATIVGSYTTTTTPDKIHSELYGGTDQNNLALLQSKNKVSDTVIQTNNNGNISYLYSFNYDYTDLVEKTKYFTQVYIYSGTPQAVVDKSKIESFTSGGAGIISSNNAEIGVTNAQKALDDCKVASTPEQISAGKCKTQEDNLTKAQVALKAEQSNNEAQSAGNLPYCWRNITDVSVSGCTAQLIYYLLFVPTSFLFALTGVFFDSTFAYSVNDESYRSPFVLEGWGLVRDFVNMFFIFVLLYIAFSTILSIHGFKTKEMIINVVIIGLLMNFSLFAGQLIIDSSNILARVFYNSNAIKITQGGANGVSNNTPGADVESNGVIPLSAALVNKVNPQNLIINAKNAGPIKDKNGNTHGEADTNTEVSNGTFIFILFLAIAVNIVGMIVFLSVGLIFIARVVGLWIYMILAPLAFFSYTVPSMQGMNMVGWKKWWPEVLSLAFVAPIFIFFLYLILKFLETGLGLINAGGKTGLQFIIGIIVPFAFIMILLWKAKDIAKKMSGELGQSITGGVAAIGGLALGGAALGAAAIGRGTIGAFMKGASTGDTSASRLAAGTSTGRIDRWKGRLQTYSGIHAAQTAVGGRINRDQTRVEGYAHARQELDKEAGARYHGKKFNELTQVERGTVRQRISRDHQGQQQFGKSYGKLTAAEKATVDAAVNPQLAANTSHADHLVTEARGKQGLVSNLVQSSRNGSFDVRNISKVVADEYDRGFSKVITGMTSGIANGMRGALKQSNINYGTGQKDIFKDLGNTITDALKSATIKVDLSHVGAEHKEGDHGGGHH